MRRIPLVLACIVALAGVTACRVSKGASASFNTGASCVYSTFTADAAGNLTIQCQGVVTPPDPTPIPPDPTPPTGCNPGAIQPQFAWGVLQARQPSGAVYAYPVPAPQFGRISTITQGQQPATAPNTITEYTVSTCPGVIDKAAGPCYYWNSFVNQNGMDIYRSTPPDGACYAPLAGTYYLNVRWSYTSCPSGSCGFSLQWISNW